MLDIIIRKQEYFTRKKHLKVTFKLSQLSKKKLYANQNYILFIVGIGDIEDKTN